MDVLTAKELEESCKIPVLVGTLLCHVVFIPVKMIGMFSIFVRIEKRFNPHRIAANQRSQAFLARLSPNKHR
jgi:hypothetical protein